MGLAEVEIPMSEFNLVHQHISSYAPTATMYGNMHLRQTRQQKNVMVLRYLHAMRVRPTAEKAIDGMICGPELLWAYELLPGRTKARLLVSIDEASDKERDRIGRQFLKEILGHVTDEQGVEHHPPTLTPGHLSGYLPNSRPSMPKFIAIKRRPLSDRDAPTERVGERVRTCGSRRGFTKSDGRIFSRGDCFRQDEADTGLLYVAQLRLLHRLGVVNVGRVADDSAVRCERADGGRERDQPSQPVPLITIGGD